MLTGPAEAGLSVASDEGSTSLINAILSRTELRWRRRGLAQPDQQSEV
jgi:hypothetical protein